MDSASIRRASVRCTAPLPMNTMRAALAHVESDWLTIHGTSVFLCRMGTNVHYYVCIFNVH